MVFGFPFFSCDHPAKGPQQIAPASAPAAADVVRRGYWQAYRFGRLSNHALAADGVKCRCGPLGLETYYYNDKPAHLRAERGSGSDKRRTGDSLYDDLHRFGSRAVRGGSFQRTSTAQEVLKPAVSSSLFWSLLGLRPKVTRARGRGTLPSEKNERAAEDAGPYEVHDRNCGEMPRTG